MTEQTRENLNCTRATHAIERLVPGDEAQRLCVQISKGKIGMEEALRQIARKYGVESRDIHD